jgi:membrane fusion protein, multidrug efflux system
MVKDGAELFHIEQAPFAAAVQQAQGALFRAQADYANATAQAKRAEELVKTSATSLSERDRKVAEQQKAQGNVITADADLKTAQINLSYTEIKAPISGMIGRTQVTKGNVVGPDSGLLTTIVSQDPTYVVFPVSQREFLRLEGEREKTGERLVVKLAFSNGQAYDQIGKIDFVDITVDRATDSVTVRATMPNPVRKLIDGQLVRVLVQGDQPDMKILIPQSALIADQQGVYVFVVEDGKAVVRRVVTAGENGSDAVVESGLKPGDQVIAEGMESLRPGAPVAATPAQPTLNRS